MERGQSGSSSVGDKALPTENVDFAAMSRSKLMQKMHMVDLEISPQLGNAGSGRYVAAQNVAKD